MRERLVAGIDSSTQSCKVVIRDADTGCLRRFGQMPHPEGTEVDPEAWWSALLCAVAEAGGLDDVSAVSIAGQQHGLVALDADGEIVRPALLWNDTRSAQAATELIAELGERDRGDASAGPQVWAAATGSVPVASLTVTKLRWLAEHEPDNASRVAAIALPHDWLTWRFRGAGSLESLTTDRSDASGTGYFDTAGGIYRRDLLTIAMGRNSEDIVLPRVLEPRDVAGHGDPTAGLGHLVLGPGAGDNAAAALGLGLKPGDVALSVGTSGVVSAVSNQPIQDPSGLIAGFADATGNFLSLAVSLNGSKVLDTAANLLDIDHKRLSELALKAEPGAQGVTLVPYLAGERTPNLPLATGSILGLTLGSATRENLARAAMEGLVCGLAEGLDAMREQGVTVDGVSLIGGAARSRALQIVASAVLEIPVRVPAPGEYVADGAARQAVWVLDQGEEAPSWRATESKVTQAAPSPRVRQRYAERCHLFAELEA